MIRSSAFPTDPVPALHRPQQVFHRPVLPARRVSFRSKEVIGPVLAQFFAQFCHLFGFQLRSHWSTPMFFKTCDAALTIFATPFHQAAAIAPRDLDDLCGLVALRIQSYGLISSANIAILGLRIRLLKLSDLLFGHLKSFSRHVFIV